MKFVFETRQSVFILRLKITNKSAHNFFENLNVVKNQRTHTDNYII